MYPVKRSFPTCDYWFATKFLGNFLAYKKTTALTGHQPNHTVMAHPLTQRSIKTTYQELNHLDLSFTPRVGVDDHSTPFKLREHLSLKCRNEAALVRSVKPIIQVS
jgi:hypothetical protein